MQVRVLKDVELDLTDYQLLSRQGLLRFVSYIISERVLGRYGVLVVKSPDNLVPFLLEDQLHNPIGIKKVRVTLHIGGHAPCLNLRQYEVFICSECLLDHHLVGCAEYRVYL